MHERLGKNPEPDISPRFYNEASINDWERNMPETTSDLAQKTCTPCRGGVPPLKGSELQALAKQLSGWDVVEEHHIVKRYTFPDFVTGLRFVGRIGALAEEQGHHPNILLAWGRVEITLWTHAVSGLTESDFILAAKIDRLPR